MKEMKQTDFPYKRNSPVVIGGVGGKWNPFDCPMLERGWVPNGIRSQ